MLLNTLKKSMKKENPVEGASINADDQRVFKPND
jgi:hypothetical protein